MSQDVPIRQDGRPNRKYTPEHLRKAHSVHVRLTETELDVLQRQADKREITLSELVRRQALRGIDV